ncbi:MAG: fumarylacetoacetate hydrolase family protein [Alphaproteobacteria bacterium]
MTNIAAAALRLVEARQRHHAIVSLAPDLPDDVDEAYAIQEATHAGILAVVGGGKAVGYKIGCTNPQAQAELGINAPFHGRLLSPYLYSNPAEIPAERYFMTVLEPEIAFRIGRDLPADQAPFERDLVNAAVAEVIAAIEVVDSRYQDWTSAGAEQAIADNAFNGAWVHGTPHTDLDLLTLDEVPVAISVDGELRETGVGGNALGHPLNALSWLVHELARKGEGLKAGDYVSTGTCTATVRVEKGQRAVATFGPLGEVELVVV